MLYSCYLITAICIFYALPTVSAQKKTALKKKILRGDPDIPQSNPTFEVSNELDDRKKHLYFHEFSNNSCWMKLNATAHFEAMNNLYGQYEKVLETFQKAVIDDKFDDRMLKMMLDNRGVAMRTLHKVGNNPAMIPAGLNLGGYCMMRLRESINFFHRMKLRNSTIFRVDYLHHDLMNMLLTVRLSLQDLHLVGAYERVLTDKNPSILFYAPTYGEVEILLLNVKYKMEGRFRLLQDRLIVEHVISDLTIDNILMTYPKDINNKPPIKLQPENLGEFLNRLKIDLDKWLKDYFNDYLVYFELKGDSKAELQKYDKMKIMAENDFIDNSINEIKTRLHQVEASAVDIPSFTILAVHGMEFKLTNGIIRGLDTLYRRSPATGRTLDQVRKVDAIVGFSNLKVMYKYQATINNGMPPLVGLVILSADELAARMSLGLAEQSESFELTFDFVGQMKPEFLTIEGAANRVIANYKHILEHHILSIMSNTLLHNVRKLSSLAKCETDLIGHHEPENVLFPDHETAHEHDNKLENFDNNESNEKTIIVPSNNYTPDVNSYEMTNDNKPVEAQDEIIELDEIDKGGINSQELYVAFGPNVTRKHNIKDVPIN